MGEKGVGKLSRETPPPCEGEPMGASIGETGLSVLYSTWWGSWPTCAILYLVE